MKVLKYIQDFYSSGTLYYLSCLFVTAFAIVLCIASFLSVHYIELKYSPILFVSTLFSLAVSLYYGGISLRIAMRE